MITNLKLFIRFVDTMDNIQVILYVVFLIGYFIYKMLAGKKKPITRQDTDQYDQMPKGESNYPRNYQDEDEYDPTQGPKSFEEILEELAGGGRERKIREVKEVKEQKQVQVQEKAEEAKEILTNYEQDAREVYRSAIDNAGKHMTLDERIDIDNLDINIKEVEDLEESEVASRNEYISMLRNLDDAKKAIVMSEIINRKYN